MRLSLLVIACVSAGCGGWSTAHPIDAGTTTASPIETIESAIFMPRCALGSCHAPPTVAAHLDLSSVASSCKALVQAPSCLFTQKMLVVPGQPDKSYLYAKLVGDNLGSQPDGPCAGLTNGHPPMRMPYGGAKLPDDQISQVRGWISDGAKCEAMQPDAGGGVTDGGMGMGQDSGGAVPQVAALTAAAGLVVAGKHTTLTVTLSTPAPASGQWVTLSVDDATVLGVPASTFVAAGETSATFWVQGLRPARPTSVHARTDGADVATQIGVGGLRLAELFYHSTGGGDDGKQWIKLSNGSGVAIDLSGYSLGAGSASYVETTVSLSGTLAPGACFVVGGPESSAADGSPHYAEVARFAPPIPHAGVDSASGVALFDRAMAQASTLPLDAVVFGGRNAGGLVRPDGSVATPDAADVLGGHSLVRMANGWRDANAPTPNDCKPNP
jgi:hypothetical protein